MSNKIIEAFCFSIFFVFVFNLFLVITGANLGSWIRETPSSSLNEFNITSASLPMIYIRVVVGILQVLSLVISGFIVGLVIKKRGLIWGGVLGGVLFILLAILGTIFGSIIDLSIAVDWDYLVSLFPKLPFIIFLTAAGGYLGERFALAKKHSKKK